MHLDDHVNIELLKVGDSKLEKIDMLQEVTKKIEGHTLCALGDVTVWRYKVSSGISNHRLRRGSKRS